MILPQNLPFYSPFLRTMRTSDPKVRMSRTLDFTGFLQNWSRGSLLGLRCAHVPTKREFYCDMVTLDYVHMHLAFTNLRYQEPFCWRADY